jgi:hypothetical protein
MGFIKKDIKNVVLPLLLTGMLQNIFAMDLPKGCWIPEGYVEYLSSSLDQRDVKSWLIPFANIIIQEE